MHVHIGKQTIMEPLNIMTLDSETIVTVEIKMLSHFRVSRMRCLIYVAHTDAVTTTVCMGVFHHQCLFKLMQWLRVHLNRVHAKLCLQLQVRMKSVGHSILDGQ